MASLRFLFSFVLLVTPALAAAQSRPHITTAEIDGDLRFLSSDLLEGRAPATRGGRLASEYIASRLRSAGVEPGVNGDSPGLRYGAYETHAMRPVGADAICCGIPRRTQ